MQFSLKVNKNLEKIEKEQFKKQDELNKLELKFNRIDKLFGWCLWGGGVFVVVSFMYLYYIRID
jgi:hypothetical protein